MMQYHSTSCGMGYLQSNKFIEAYTVLVYVALKSSYDSGLKSSYGVEHLVIATATTIATKGRGHLDTLRRRRSSRPSTPSCLLKGGRPAPQTQPAACATQSR